MSSRFRRWRSPTAQAHGLEWRSARETSAAAEKEQIDRVIGERIHVGRGERETAATGRAGTAESAVRSSSDSSTNRDSTGERPRRLRDLARDSW